MTDHPLSPGGQTYAVLDANALLPPRLADVLFDLHLVGVYNPRWTEEIEDEFIRNWAAVSKSLKGKELDRYMASANFPADEVPAKKRLARFQMAVGDEWEILGHMHPNILSQVPPRVDKGDVHVAACAIQLKTVLLEEGGSSADKIFIVSSNTRHLAVTDLGGLGIDVIRPGKFIDRILQQAPEQVERALSDAMRSLKKPAYTQAEWLGVLQVHGATQTAAHCSKAWKVRIPTTHASRNQGL